MANGIITAQEIIDVLRKFDVHQCQRTYTSKYFEGMGEKTLWAVTTKHLPFADRIMPQLINGTTLIRFETYGKSLDAQAFSREVYIPKLTANNASYALPSFLQKYMTSRGSLPFGFATDSYWVKHQFHTAEFLESCINELKKVYAVVYDIMYNERVQEVKNAWEEATDVEREGDLHELVLRLAEVQAKKAAIMVE